MSQPAWRVLVADDDPTVALLMPLALGPRGFSVTVVNGGAAALMEFERQTFDMALLDIEMPGPDGFEVCAALRQRYGMGLPVVLISGRTDDAFVEKSKALGAPSIAKPVDWQGLGDRLLALLPPV